MGHRGDRLTPVMYGSKMQLEKKFPLFWHVKSVNGITLILILNTFDNVLECCFKVWRIAQFFGNQFWTLLSTLNNKCCTVHGSRGHIAFVFRQIISFTEATVFWLYTKLSKHDSCTQFYLINSLLHSYFTFSILKKFVLWGRVMVF